MGIHVHRGTMPGGVTPICNECGISLCWDISNEDFERAKAFWDAWICVDCNGGVPLSLKDWEQKNRQSQSAEASSADQKNQ